MITKFITKTLSSAASSILSGHIKKYAKEKIEELTSKSDHQAQEEASRILGYDTNHYDVKKNEVIFKSSAIFLHEWLTRSPFTAGKIARDEEDGDVYFDGEPMNNAIRRELLGKFLKATSINSPSVNGHFDKALDLLDVSDFTASKFKKEFVGKQAYVGPGDLHIIDNWLTNLFGDGLVTDKKYANMLFRKWLIGTARRAMNPGETLDGCLLLQGPAGTGKTQFFRKILPRPFEHRTGEINCDVKNPQKFVESIVGKTVACFDELSVLDHPGSLETFKSLLSSQNIDVRMPWARKPRRYALRQGFAATTNRNQFIADPFLSRRLWVIKVNRRLNFDNLLNGSKLHELWNEAVHFALQGESCILSPDEQKQVEEYNKQFEIK